VGAREHRFVQVDVFTDRVFGGNPLAVLVDGRGLSDAEMQAIARENNLSETTFVLPATRADCAARVRIFTPTRELAFAGHPTLGTAWVLATRSRGGAPRFPDALLPADTRRFALEEGIGAVPVELEGEPARPTFVWMTHGEPTFGPALRQRGAFARALGLEESDLLPGAPIEAGSTGTGFVFVPVRDRAALDRIAVNGPALIAAKGPQPEHGVFVLAPDPDAKAHRVHSRMFVPEPGGVREDPATGSASGPLGAYLVRHRLVEGDGEVAIVSEQGTAMGRPSLVHIRCTMRDGRVADLRVGGGVVPVLEGVLALPELSAA
jgi:trans-2,3-dihydro-3-hydroxyanthranilate isomerase